jgi:hypothetical protein
VSTECAGLKTARGGNRRLRKQEAGLRIEKFAFEPQKLLKINKTTWVRFSGVPRIAATNLPEHDKRMQMSAVTNGVFKFGGGQLS